MNISPIRDYSNKKETISNYSNEILIKAIEVEKIIDLIHQEK